MYFQISQKKSSKETYYWGSELLMAYHLYLGLIRKLILWGIGYSLGILMIEGE